MKIKYRRVDTRTENGLEIAEKLLANGWKVISGNFFITGNVLMEKKGD